MGLDVNTVRGQQTLQDEARCVSIVEAAFPTWTFVHTHKATEASVDGFLVSQGTVRAVVEQKSRYKLSLSQFNSAFDGKWLVTFEKLVKARDIARSLCVPLYGFLFLVDEDCVLVKRIWSPSTDWATPLEIKKTSTQATCNGGVANRDNAFIPMHDAKIYRMGAV